jgi:hypothetical protein
MAITKEENVFRTFVFVIAGLSFLLGPAEAQNTDCNQLARDLVTKSYSAGSSDYYMLLFLSSLTQMSEESAKDALAHSGQVAVGPIKIGPGTWNKDTQKDLKSKLEKIINIEQIKQSAASISMSSGLPDAAKPIESCIASNGGFYVSLNDRGKETAILEMMWTSYPGTKLKPVIESVTIVHGKVIGGSAYTNRGAQLDERMMQRVTIERTDPKKDITAVVNTLNAGSNEAYLPPSELPPPPPPKVIRELVQGNPMDVGSGARYDGDRNPGCRAHEAAACVTPKHGGKLVPGSGGVNLTNKTDRAGYKDPIENSQQYCVTFWANTGACQTPVYIQGAATAIEEYTVDDK